VEAAQEAAGELKRRLVTEGLRSADRQAARTLKMPPNDPKKTPS
jgi:hypothetical protein